MRIDNEEDYLTFVERAVTGSSGFGVNGGGRRKHIEKYWTLPKKYPCLVTHLIYDPDSLGEDVGRPVCLSRFNIVYMDRREGDKDYPDKESFILQ